MEYYNCFSCFEKRRKILTLTSNVCELNFIMIDGYRFILV